MLRDVPSHIENDSDLQVWSNIHLHVWIGLNISDQTSPDVLWCDLLNINLPGNTGSAHVCKLLKTNRV